MLPLSKELSAGIAPPTWCSKAAAGPKRNTLIDGRWNYRGAGRPRRFPENDSVLVRDLEPVEREYRLYFPLYNGVERLDIGVPEAAGN